jgi:hypothetical protein
VDIKNLTKLEFTALREAGWYSPVEVQAIEQQKDLFRNAYISKAEDVLGYRDLLDRTEKMFYYAWVANTLPESISAQYKTMSETIRSALAVKHV